MKWCFIDRYSRNRRKKSQALRGILLIRERKRHELIRNVNSLDQIYQQNFTLHFWHSENCSADDSLLNEYMTMLFVFV